VPGRAVWSRRPGRLCLPAAPRPRRQERSSHLCSRYPPVLRRPRAASARAGSFAAPCPRA